MQAPRNFRQRRMRYPPMPLWVVSRPEDGTENRIKIQIRNKLQIPKQALPFHIF